MILATLLSPTLWIYMDSICHIYLGPWPSYMGSWVWSSHSRNPHNGCINLYYWIDHAELGNFYIAKQFWPWLTWSSPTPNFSSILWYPIKSGHVHACINIWSHLQIHEPSQPLMLKLHGIIVTIHSTWGTKKKTTGKSHTKPHHQSAPVPAWFSHQVTPSARARTYPAPPGAVRWCHPSPWRRRCSGAGHPSAPGSRWV